MRSLVQLIAAGLMALSCSQPLSVETFVRSSAKDASGRYPFILCMDDSLAVYSIRFFTRMDISADEFNGLQDIAVDVLLESPSGKGYAERVYLGKKDFVSGRGFAKDYNMPYRTGFRPMEYGQWNMYLTLPEKAPADMVRGMGVCLSKQIDGNGKR